MQAVSHESFSILGPSHQFHEALQYVMMFMQSGHIKMTVMHNRLGYSPHPPVPPRLSLFITHIQAKESMCCNY